MTDDEAAHSISALCSWLSEQIEPGRLAQLLRREAEFHEAQKLEEVSA